MTKQTTMTFSVTNMEMVARIGGNASTVQPVTHFTPFLTIFIWLMMLYTLLLIIPYFLYAIWFLYRHDREGSYDTISSQCADPNRPGHRFLLATTCVVSGCLAALYVEEYNSREQGDTLDRFLFWSNVISVLLLPLIGIFHSDGGGRIRRYEFFCLDLPIWISNALHVIGTLAFVAMTTINNFIWVSTNDVLHSLPERTYIIALSVTTLIFASSFVLLQIFIKGCLKRVPWFLANSRARQLFFDRVESPNLGFLKEVPRCDVFQSVPDRNDDEEHFIEYNFERDSFVYGVVPKEQIAQSRHFIFHCCAQRNIFSSQLLLERDIEEEAVSISLDRRKVNRLFHNPNSHYAIGKAWRMASFTCEAITVVLIILSAASQTVVRNPNVQITGQCIFLAQCLNI